MRVDPVDFQQIPSWNVTLPKESSIRIKPPTSDNEGEVMTAISNLANTVIANTTSRALAKYVFHTNHFFATLT